MSVTGAQNDDTSTPIAKRVKFSKDKSGIFSDGENSIQDSKNYWAKSPMDVENDSDDSERSSYQITNLETVLPHLEMDKKAIVEYETMRANENIPDDLKSRLSKARWSRGKASIYVDAFNLALETVLEDESHLFNEKELQVFSHWRDLTYEAQYL